MWTAEVPHCTLASVSTGQGPGTASGWCSWWHRAGLDLAPQRRGCPISVDGGIFAAYRVGHAPPGSFSSDLISFPVPRSACVNGGERESICVLTQVQPLWRRSAHPTKSRNMQDAARRSTAVWFMFQGGMPESTARSLVNHYSHQGGLCRLCGPQNYSIRDRFLHNGRRPVEGACRDIRTKPGSRLTTISSL